MCATRHALPQRRASETMNYQAAGQRYTATVSRFPNGDVAEVFVSNHKQGSMADNSARAAAIVLSIALQYGVPLDAFISSMPRDSMGRPLEPIGAALDLLV